MYSIEFFFSTFKDIHAISGLFIVRPIQYICTIVHIYHMISAMVPVSSNNVVSTSPCEHFEFLALLYIGTEYNLALGTSTM